MGEMIAYGHTDEKEPATVNDGEKCRRDMLEQVKGDQIENMSGQVGLRRRWKFHLRKGQEDREYGTVTGGGQMSPQEAVVALV